jgi:hypothetical protein
LPESDFDGRSDFVKVCMDGGSDFNIGSGFMKVCVDGGSSFDVGSAFVKVCVDGGSGFVKTGNGDGSRFEKVCEAGGSGFVGAGRSESEGSERASPFGGSVFVSAGAVFRSGFARGADSSFFAKHFAPIAFLLLSDDARRRRLPLHDLGRLRRAIRPRDATPVASPPPKLNSELASLSADLDVKLKVLSSSPPVVVVSSVNANALMGMTIEGVRR